MESNFFNWFTTENVEVMEGNSHEKPSKVKGRDILNMLPKVLKTLALTTVISTSSPAIAQENPKDNNKNDNKTEQNDNKKTTKFFNVADVQSVRQDGSTYYIVDDKAVITPEMLNQKEVDKKYKKGEKDLRRNAEEDRFLQDTIPVSEATYSGMYSKDSKNITIPFLKNDLKEKVEENSEIANHLSSKGIDINETSNWIEKRNNPKSLIYKAVLAHEEQHRLNDKLGTYAPGLNPEQYAIINQYDEVASRVSALNVYVNAYQEQIKSGAKKEDALKVFNDAEDFKFYQDAISNGLDPQSKDGKAKMVSGCFDLWKNEDANMMLYKEQLYDIASKSVEENTFQSMIIGNEKEMQRRIEKIFDNILINGKPSNLRKYLPQEILKVDENTKTNLSYRVREKTGLDAEDVAKVKQDISGKNHKQKTDNLMKALRATDNQPEQNKTNYKNFNINKINDGR